MSQAATATAKQRLMSLDVFRGVTIALIVLVNVSGNDHNGQCSSP